MGGWCGEQGGCLYEICPEKGVSNNESGALNGRFTVYLQEVSLTLLSFILLLSVHAVTLKKLPVSMSSRKDRTGTNTSYYMVYKMHSLKV